MRISYWSSDVCSSDLDDDQDAVILFVRVEGPGSCHVGFRSCFYREAELEAADPSRPVKLLRIEAEPAFDSAAVYAGVPNPTTLRSEEHTSELQSLMRISYAVFCLKKKNKTKHNITRQNTQ